MSDATDRPQRSLTASPWRYVVAAFHDISTLKSDWDSYGAKPVAASAVRQSFSLLPLILADDSPAPAVVPTSDGGVQFEWHRGGIDVEVKIGASGHVSYLIADAALGIEVEEEGTLNVSAIRDAIERMPKGRSAARAPVTWSAWTLSEHRSSWS